MTHKYNFLIDYFSKNMPDAKTELHYDSHFHFVISVILSAQCTDKRVNSITPGLFRKFPNPVDLANSNYQELFPFIKSISYPNNKTNYLLNMAKVLTTKFNSKVPSGLNELSTLPGVGRKSANAIAAVLYNMPFMPVDTHVFRVSKRLGLVDKNAKTPLAVEKELTANIPKEYLNKAHHWLVLHGRYTCLARKPKCDQCGLTEICNYIADIKLKSDIGE
jgi:endonuclease-3